mmetsp:Transcript_27070/g.49274  ORF Transcript_27070/g.49274 Transcript_27070/m.49274 type:complete len:125 (+) Transcript_27070:13-387(+)
METQQNINDRAHRIMRGLDAAFGVKADTLAKALRKTGRRLPKRLRAEAALIVDAQALGGHPRLLRQLDGTVLDAAEAKVTAHLKTIDRADQRKGRMLSIAGVIAFNILVVAAGFVVWMVWADKL